MVTAASSELIIYASLGYGTPGLPEVTRHAIMAPVREASTTTGQQAAYIAQLELLRSRRREHTDRPCGLSASTGNYSVRVEVTLLDGALGLDRWANKAPFPNQSMPRHALRRCHAPKT